MTRTRLWHGQYEDVPYSEQELGEDQKFVLKVYGANGFRYCLVDLAKCDHRSGAALLVDTLRAAIREAIFKGLQEIGGTNYFIVPALCGCRTKGMLPHFGHLAVFYDGSFEWIEAECAEKVMLTSKVVTGSKGNE